MTRTEQTAADAMRSVLRIASAFFLSWLAWLPVCAADTAAPARPATAAEPAVREEVEVARHLIEVVAQAPDGAPLLGLGPADFSVRIDGSERPVVSVDAAAPGRTAPAGTPDGTTADRAAAADTSAANTSATARPPRWIALVFHADGISPLYRRHAIEAARAVLGSADPVLDRIAIVMLTKDGIEFRQNFAPAANVSPEALPGIDALVGPTDPLATRATQLATSLAECRKNSGSAGNCFENVSAEFMQTSRDETKSVVHSLAGLVTTVSALPGRKAVLLFSDGVVLTPGQVVIDSFGRYDPSLGTYFSRLQDPPSWDFIQLLTDAVRARVAFVCWRTGGGLDASDRSASRAYNSSEAETSSGNAFASLERTSTEALRDLATTTGGRLVTTGTPAQAASGLLAQLGGAYTLAVKAERGDTFRSKVKVRLTRARGTVSAPEHLVRSAGPVKHLAARLDVGQASPEGTPARLVVDLQSLAVDGGDAGASSRVSIYYVVLDASGRRVRDDFVLMAVPRGHGGTSFVFPMNFQLGPGRYVVDVHASDVVGGGQVTISRPLVVGAP